MDTGKAFLVIGLTLILVIGFNAVIYAAATRRRKNSVGEFDLMRKVSKRARDPWAEDNAKLDELAKTLASLKEDQNSAGDNNDG